MDRTRGERRANRMLACLLAAVWFVAAVFALPRFGPTFDAVLGDYAYGELEYEFWRTLDREPLRFDRDPAWFADPSHPAWKRVFPPKYVYPLGATLSAAGCALFARTLHWLDPVDAHHLIAPFSIAALIALLAGFLARRAGRGAALAAVALLMSHPRFLGHAFNDIKDAPTLPLLFGALFSYLRALEHGRARWVIAGALLTGLGLAQKINAIWPPAFFAVAFVLFQSRALLRGDRGARRVFFAALAAGPVCAAAYFAVSPQYLVDGTARLQDHLRFVLVENVRTEFQPGFSIAPLRNLVLATPLTDLPLLALGAVVAWRRRLLSREALVMLGLLFVVPIVRPCLPDMRYYNVLRHYLETVPVLALFAGIGLAALARTTAAAIRASRAAGRLAAALVCLAVLVPRARVIAAIHPFETTYYNALAGGLAGAQRARLADANDYWCQSYREGLRWLNAHAAPGALLVVPVAPWMVGAVRRAWLRPDIGFTDDEDALRALVDNGLIDPHREAARWTAVPEIWFMYVPLDLRTTKPPYDAIVSYCETALRPDHVIEADGGEILRFYRVVPGR